MLISDYKFIYALFGLGSIWCVYLFFAAGYQSVKRNDDSEVFFNKSRFPFSGVSEWKPFQYLFCDIICWASTILAARFYTSRGFVRVVSGLFNGEAAYSIYQSYARNVNSSFSVVKIPYILMLTFLTAMLIWSATGILIEVERIKPIQLFHLTSLFLSYLYFGIARGTNFEMYIAFVALVYCILNRKNRKNDANSKKSIIIVLLLGFLVVVIFRIVVEARGVSFVNRICKEITYLPDRMISRLFPALTNMMTSIFRYLGWGTFTIGVYKYDIVLEGFKGIIANLMPLGFRTLFGSNLPDIIRATVSVGVGWVPDYMTFVDYLGLPLFFIFIFLLGRLGAWLKFSPRIPQLLADVIGLLVFIEMLSIPVGNFLFTSTPNMLTVLAAALWYLYEKISIRRIS